jgi:hypothetical protein
VSTNFRALCVELTEALRRQHDWYIEDNGATLPQLDELVRRAETALAEPEPEIYYEFTVLNDEYCTEAGGTAPTLSQAVNEGRHYFAQYSQDGQYTLEVRRVEVISVPS